jgi:ssDNA-binding Zn-finger/Zn-ribbon topoisomerase 1
MEFLSFRDMEKYLNFTTGPNARSRFVEGHQNYSYYANEFRANKNYLLLMGFSKDRPKCSCDLLANPIKANAFFYGCPNYNKGGYCGFRAFVEVDEVFPPIPQPLKRKRRLVFSSDDESDDSSSSSSSSSKSYKVDSDESSSSSSSSSRSAKNDDSFDDSDSMLIDHEEPSPDFQTKIHEAEKIIEDAFRLYKPNELASSTTTGKDSIVLNHIIEAQFNHLHYWKVTIDLIQPDERSKISFPLQVEDKTITIKAITLKDGFSKLTSPWLNANLDLRAVFLGRRNTDLEDQTNTLPAFQPTDPDWPSFMRINPLASWTYHDIWKYIDLHKLPYPKEYEQGYSSLGPNAKRNPLLKNKDGTYKHARELVDIDTERVGRK